MNCNSFRTLSVKKTALLSVGDHVFITIKSMGIVRASALVAKTDPLTLMAITEQGRYGVVDMRKFRWYDAPEPSSELSIKVKSFYPRETDFPSAILEQAAELTVDTPDGTIRVSDKLDKDYPGVLVDLPTAMGSPILAMVEYIPAGEGACDYDPAHPDHMEAQKAELVPPRRRTVHNDDGTESWEATAGLVTRSWPDDTNNPDIHLRTFHYGYESKP